MNIETITEQALSLPPTSRAYLTEILLESFDYEEDFSVYEAWRQLIQKRCKVIDANPTLLIDGQKFITELKQRYPCSFSYILKLMRIWNKQLRFISNHKLIWESEF